MIRRFHVEGMACRHCAITVTAALLGIEHVDDVAIDLATRVVDVETSRPVDDAAVKGAIEAEGYELTPPGP